MENKNNDDFDRAYESWLQETLSFLFHDMVKKKKRKCHVYHNPFDVRLPLNNETADDKIYNVVQPDICVVCDLSKLDDRGCIGAPDLIVEILSPSTSKKDWSHKFNLYEAAGVREYWIVNPKAKTVNVFLLQSDGQYDLGAEYDYNQLAPVHIFEGLEIDLKELFTGKKMSKKEKTKFYETPPIELNYVGESFTVYGTLDLDETKRYTYADYLSWMDDRRMELINGVIYFVSAPLRIHARISAKLFSRIDKFIEKKKGKCHIYYAPIDVRLPLNNETADDKIYNVVQPDICVICDLSKLDDRGCIGAPDLIVEVLSPSTSKKDWNHKFNLYEAAGVREYWIVSPKAKTVNIFLLQSDGQYDLGTEYDYNQKAPVHIFKGLEIDLKELFE